MAEMKLSQISRVIGSSSMGAGFGVLGDWRALNFAWEVPLAIGTFIWAVILGVVLGGLVRSLIDHQAGVEPESPLGANTPGKYAPQIWPLKYKRSQAMASESRRREISIRTDRFKTDVARFTSAMPVLSG